MKIALVLLLLVGVANAQFADIPPGHWSEEAVLTLTEAGIITGLPDGLFHGDEDVTRYQVSLMLARVWKTWQNEDLDEVWGQVLVTQRELAEVTGDLSIVETTLSGYDRQLASLNDLMSRTGDRASVARLETQAEAARGDLEQLRGVTARLRERLKTQEDDAGQKALALLESRFSDALAAQRREVQRTSDDLSRTQGDLESLLEGSGGVADQLAGVGERLEGVDVRLGSLEQADQNGVSGTLGLATGVEGEEAALSLHVDALTPYGNIQGVLAQQRTHLDVGADLGRVSLRGFYAAAEERAATLAGLQLNLSPALQVGVVGGGGTGLRVGGYAAHLPFAQDSVIPGLSLAGGALLWADTFALETVFGEAGYTFALGQATVKPGILYRRVETNYQAIIPELELGYTFTGARLSAQARYGLVDDLSQSNRITVPEGALNLTFDRGAFIGMSLRGGLPPTGPLALENPAETIELDVGVRVGYNLQLESLW